MNATSATSTRLPPVSVRRRNNTHGHLASEALGGDVRGVERLDLRVVEEQPAVVVVVLAVADERVVVPAVRRARVYCHAYQLVPVGTRTTA